MSTSPPPAPDTTRWPLTAPIDRRGAAPMLERARPAEPALARELPETLRCWPSFAMTLEREMRGLRATSALGFGGTACARSALAPAVSDMFSFAPVVDATLGDDSGWLKILVGRVPVVGGLRGERAFVICWSVRAGDVGCSPTAARPGARPATTLCRFARELAVGAMSVEIVRFRTGIEPPSDGEGLFVPASEPEAGAAFVGRRMPSELVVFDEPAAAALGLAPSEVAATPNGSFVGLLVLRILSGAVRALSVPVGSGLSKDGIGDLERADGMLDAVADGTLSCEELAIGGFAIPLPDGLRGTGAF